MIKRKLGRTGLEVSEVAFGCVEIGMPYGLGRESVDDMPTEEEAIHLLQTALKSGINFFDTAPVYGTSESLIGKAFKADRSRVVIATKCGYFQNSDGVIPGYNELKKNIEASLKASLAALQTDYVDVYMLHQGTSEILSNPDVRDIFISLKKSGVIKATGVSVYTTGQAELAIEAGAWDVIQVPFNIMDQRHAALFDRIQSTGMGLIIRSVLMKGILTEKGKNLHPALADVESHIKNYEVLTTRLNVKLSTLAPRFVLSFPQVSSLLVGIDKLNYLEESIAAANGEYLDESLLKQAEALAYPDPPFLDLPKWDREGWLK